MTTHYHTSIQSERYPIKSTKYTFVTIIIPETNLFRFAHIDKFEFDQWWMSGALARGIILTEKKEIKERIENELDQEN